MVAEQLHSIGITPSAILLEPAARNTAPAITLAALAAENPSNLLLVMPSDHMIKNLPEFQNAVVASIAIAQSGWLVTFGIEPTGPETGYGYIQQGEAIAGTSQSFSVTQFVEKPTKQNAEKMLADGGYHWNAGIFLFRADSYLAAVKKYAPEILLACQSAMASKQMENGRCYPESEAFASAPSDSIDYAIMERAETVAVTPVSPGWSDVGSWDALFEISNKDDQSNVIFGQALTIGSTSNLIHSHDLEITVFGVDNLIIVTNENKVMILPRGQSQNVKKIAQKLAEED